MHVKSGGIYTFKQSGKNTIYRISVMVPFFVTTP